MNLPLKLRSFRKFVEFLSISESEGGKFCWRQGCTSDYPAELYDHANLGEVDQIHLHIHETSLWERSFTRQVTSFHILPQMCGMCVIDMISIDIHIIKSYIHIWLHLGCFPWPMCQVKRPESLQSPIRAALAYRFYPRGGLLSCKTQRVWKTRGGFPTLPSISSSGGELLSCVIHFSLFYELLKIRNHLTGSVFMKEKTNTNKKHIFHRPSVSRFPILLFFDPWPSAPSSSASKSQCFCFPWRATSKASEVKMYGKSQLTWNPRMEAWKMLVPFRKGDFQVLRSMSVFGGAIWCISLARMRQERGSKE